MTTYMRGITSALGEPREIGELPQLQEDPKRLARHLKMGMRQYRVARFSSVDMAFECARRTLEKTGTPGDRIDAILYCSESFREPDFHGSLSRACQSLGLDRAFQVGISLTGCGNFSSGLKVASALIDSGAYSNILLLTADRAAAGFENRLMEPGVGVVSDGAAGCLLTAEPSPEYRLLHVELLAKNGMGTMDTEREFMKYNMASYEGRREVFRRLYARLGCGPSDFALLITNNYGSNTMKGFASESGIAPDKVFSGNVALNGHVSASDNLINLASCEDRLGASDRVLLLSTGPFSWGLAAIEVGGEKGRREGA